MLPAKPLLSSGWRCATGRSTERPFSQATLMAWSVCGLSGVLFELLTNNAHNDWDGDGVLAQQADLQHAYGLRE